MLAVDVWHENERRRYQHAGGPLTFGRAPEGDGEKILINDLHVSRNQFRLEEISDGKIRLENKGRVPIFLPGGPTLAQGQSRDLALPIRLTVGRTLVEIVPASSGSADADVLNDATHEGSRMDDLVLLKAELIGETYPYPLSFGYRLLRGIANPAELYREQLRVAENLIAFVASISLSLLKDEHFHELNQKIQGGALGCWQGGISPGDWLSLAIHAIDRLESESSDPLVNGLVQLQINKPKRGFGKCTHHLITAKNDYKHDRGPTIEEEYRSACLATGEILDLAFDALNFLSYHPIRLVQDVNPRRRGSLVDVVFLKCMGDHPGFVTEHSQHSQALRKGDLYIERAPGQLVPLYPLIHATVCQQCRAREFFFIDRVDVARGTDRQVTASLKSFDRGHTCQDADIGLEMQQLFGLE